MVNTNIFKQNVCNTLFKGSNQDNAFFSEHIKRLTRNIWPKICQIIKILSEYNISYPLYILILFSILFRD